MVKATFQIYLLDVRTCINIDIVPFVSLGHYICPSSITGKDYCNFGLVGLVATKSHACYLLGGTGWDWVRIPLGLNFSGSAGGVSGHA